MSEPHPSAFELEALHAGEPNAAAAAHVERCATCAAYLAALGHEGALLLERMPPRVFAARVAARAERPRRWVWALALPMVVAVTAVLLIATPSAPPSDTRLKGGERIAIALIAARDGKQERATGSFELRAGDRLRVELTLLERGVVSVGVLEPGGAFSPIVEGVTLDAGMHLLEPALRVDDHPSAGTIIAGTPDAVARAIAARDPSGLATLRLEVRR